MHFHPSSFAFFFCADGCCRYTGVKMQMLETKVEETKMKRNGSHPSLSRHSSSEQPGTPRSTTPKNLLRKLSTDIRTTPVIP